MTNFVYEVEYKEILNDTVDVIRPVKLRFVDINDANAYVDDLHYAMDTDRAFYTDIQVTTLPL